MTDDPLPWLKQQAYIDGTWCDAEDLSVIPVYNPADQALVGTVPNMGSVEIQAAINAAQTAFDTWHTLPAIERADYLWRWHDLVLQHQQALAQLLSLEQGKPLKEALVEIEYGTSFIRFYAEEARRIIGEVLPIEKANIRYLVFKQAIGVVAAITPWNFPNAMITRKCAPALAAGCTVVLKPSELTPFSALALAALAEAAGIPKGVINVVTGDAQAIGNTLCQDTRVRKLSFTGSTAVGKLLYQQCAPTVKKLSLELGGNAPVLIFADTDIDQAVSQTLQAKFRNSGQACIGANRILVQSDIYDTFIKALVTAVQNLRLGSSLEDSDIGPLINQAAIDKIDDLLKQATAQGAKILCGGKVHAKGPLFYEPTVIIDVESCMAIAQQEIFGPIASIMRFDTEQQAIAMANDVSAGLAAYVFTQDLTRLWRVAEQLAFGMVSINAGLFSHVSIPFGGIKESGLGREGASQGLQEYLNIKTICLGLTA